LQSARPVAAAPDSSGQDLGPPSRFGWPHRSTTHVQIRWSRPRGWNWPGATGCQGVPDSNPGSPTTRQLPGRMRSSGCILPGLLAAYLGGALLVDPHDR